MNYLFNSSRCLIVSEIIIVDVALTFHALTGTCTLGHIHVVCQARCAYTVFVQVKNIIL